jgi:hypothetical protein
MIGIANALARAAWERTHSSRLEEKKTLSSGCAISVFPIIYAAHRFEQCSAHDEQPLRPLSVLLVMALMCSILITLLFRRLSAGAGGCLLPGRAWGIRRPARSDN